MDYTPLIIAGRGVGRGTACVNFTDGDPGQTTENGARCGGTRGSGGRTCNADTGNIDSKLVTTGGAGISGNGDGEQCNWNTTPVFYKWGNRRDMIIILWRLWWGLVRPCTRRGRGRVLRWGSDRNSN